MANVDIRQGYKNAAWFTSNATLVLKQGQVVHLEQTGTYKVGDGTTQLSALSFLGGSGGGTWGSITGILSAQTDLQTALDARELLTNKQTDLTPSATKYPTVNAVIAGLNAKVSYINWRHQYGGAGAVSPLDSQHYYFAHPNIAVTNTVGDTTTHAREVAAPVTGTIVAAIINFYIGNAGSVSSEAGTLKFRNTTAATLTTLSSAVTWNTSVVDKAVVVTGLSLAVTQGDMCMTLLGTPPWATNPTGCYFSVDYIIQLP